MSICENPFSAAIYASKVGALFPCDGNARPNALFRPKGLTEDHPTLTTYFEGEIIGSKHGFVTQHDDWGASLKTDMNHWSKFNAFRPFQKQVRKGPVLIQDVAQKENIFMRWKEHFLVPDHRVRTITGASFEGFYYICFNQVKGEVNGIYFHSKSEK